MDVDRVVGYQWLYFTTPVSCSEMWAEAMGGVSNGVTETGTGVVLGLVKLNAVVGGRRWKRKEGGVGRGGDDDTAAASLRGMTEHRAASVTC
jgi:hypothetical protein